MTSGVMVAAIVAGVEEVVGTLCARPGVVVALSLVWFGSPAESEIIGRAVHK